MVHLSGVFGRAITPLGQPDVCANRHPVDQEAEDDDKQAQWVRAGLQVRYEDRELDLRRGRAASCGGACVSGL